MPIEHELVGSAARGGQRQLSNVNRAGAGVDEIVVPDIARVFESGWIGDATQMLAAPKRDMRPSLLILQDIAPHARAWIAAQPKLSHVAARAVKRQKRPQIYRRLAAPKHINHL